MDLFDSANVIFDLVESGFMLIGILMLIIALGMSTHLIRFFSVAGKAKVKVVAHENVQRSIDSETGREICRYQPVFELVGGFNPGVRSQSSEVHPRNSYPIGTVWPARFNAKTARIRTSRDIDVWPIIVGMFWLMGLAFIIVPNLGKTGNGSGIAYFLIGIGIATMIAGIFTMIKAKRRSSRCINVMAELAHIEIAYDSEHSAYDVPVFRIISGDYQGTESADVSIGHIDKDDIGRAMRARFDPHSGHINVTESEHKGPRMAPAMLLTGLIFAILGYLIGTGVI